MKKLKRIKLEGKHSLHQLAGEMSVLGITEQVLILGGGDKLYITGGSLENVNGGVLFEGNDGINCLFTGVQWSTDYVLNDTAYQWSGTIHISKSWISKGFNIYDFAHEFGHYLQQKEMGTVIYVKDVAYPSAKDMCRKGTDHDQLPCEVDATRRGNSFFEKHKYKR